MVDEVVDWFEALFDETYARATRVAYRLTGDRAVAEEIAAESLTRAYLRAGRLQQHPSPQGWVIRTATNLALDVARRGPAPCRTALSADGTDTAVLRVALVAALRALPHRQRETLALRYLADFGEAEVAAALRVSVGSVKTHIHRGLAALRRSWPRDAETPLEAVLDA